MNDMRACVSLALALFIASSAAGAQQGKPEARPPEGDVVRPSAVTKPAQTKPEPKPPVDGKNDWKKGTHFDDGAKAQGKPEGRPPEAEPAGRK